MSDGKWVSKANLQTFWQMIRSKVLPNMIGDTVTTWLTEHVNPAGSAVVVDDTLTIQGAAADAKKTGDEISGLKEDLTESVGDLKSALSTEPIIPITWEQGRLSVSGTLVDSDYAIRSRNFIPADSNHRMLWLLAGEYLLPEGANALHIRIYEYSSTSPVTLVKYTDKSMAGTQSQTLTFDSTTVAFKAVIYYTTAATYIINPNVGNLISVMWNSDALPRMVYDTNQIANDAYDGLLYGSPLPLQWEQGRLSSQGVEVASDYVCRTKLILVSAGSVLQVVQSASHSIDVFFYNGSTLVERVPSGGGSQAKYGTRFYTVPNGADGFRVYCPLDGVTPLTPDVASKMVFIAVADRAFLSILRGTENGVHRYAKLRSFGDSILTGTTYPNGSIGNVVAYDNAPYGGVAIGLGIEQQNVEHTLLSSTGLVYDAGKGSFLDNIEQTSLTDYDYLLTHLCAFDMSNFQLGDIDTATANDGTIIGGVLELLSYVRTNNKLCNIILVSVPPVGISYAGEGIFDAVYANGSSIRDLDYVMHELSDQYHFTYIDWQDMYLSYHYQEYTYQSSNVHLATAAPYRTMAEYLSRKVRYSIGKTKKEALWENGVCIINEWRSGRVDSTGAFIASSTAIRTGKIPVNGISTLYVTAPLNCTVATYYYSGSTFLSYESTAFAPRLRTVPESADACVFVIRYGNLSDISPDVGSSVMIYDYNGAVMGSVLSEGKEQYKLPMITIIDDDSNERFYNDLYPVMRDKKVTVATAVITGRVGNSGQMSWAEIEECSENGMEILSHTHSHFLSTDPDFETLTIRDITYDYQKAKNILALHGMPTDILVFSGSTGLRSKFKESAKRVYNYGILAGNNITNFQGGDPYGIRRYRIGNQTDYHCDIDTLKSLIDTLKETGGWMIWMTHTSGGSDAWASGTGEGSSAYILGQAVDYAIAQGVPVVSAAHGIKSYFSYWENTNVKPYN